MKKALYVIAGIATLLMAGFTPAAAAANDFTITSYDINYTLSRDSEQRSTLTTKETIVAVFPGFDQNHGIERYIPRQYDGHSTGLVIQSVTDTEGKAWTYTTYTSGEYEVLRIGDADKYVHGRQNYVITYTQHDVTKHYADTGRDEFYWDTNGTEWRVAIENLSIKLTVDDSLASAQTGDVQCYQGRYSNADRCELTRAGTTYMVTAASLIQGENVTVALGFAPQTFAAYTPSLLERLIPIWMVLQFFILGPLSLVLIIWLVARYFSWHRRKKELGTIVPEYLPPRNASVSLAATVVPIAQATFAAQLIDLAVRHYIKLYETKPKSFWSTAAYEIEIVKSIDDLREEEREFLHDVFKGGTAVGTKLSTEQLKKDYSLATRLSDNPSKLQKLMRGNYGLQQKDETKSAWFKRTGIALLIGSILYRSPKPSA